MAKIDEDIIKLMRRKQDIELAKAMGVQVESDAPASAYIPTSREKAKAFSDKVMTEAADLSSSILGKFDSGIARVDVGSVTFFEDEADRLKFNNAGMVHPGVTLNNTIVDGSFTLHNGASGYSHAQPATPYLGLTPEQRTMLEELAKSTLAKHLGEASGKVIAGLKAEIAALNTKVAELTERLDMQDPDWGKF